MERVPSEEMSDMPIGVAQLIDPGAPYVTVD